MKRRALFTGIATLTGIGCIGGCIGAGLWVASAQQVVLSGQAANLSEEQKALKTAKAEAARARALYQQMNKKAQTATAEADQLQAQVAATSARVQESEADLRAAQARLLIVRRMVADQSARLGQQQGPLARLMAALQNFSRRPPVLAMLQPGDLKDAVHVRAAFAHIMPAIQTRTAALRGELRQSRHLRATAMQASAALQESRAQLTARREDLAELERSKRVVALGLSSDAAKEAERAIAMNERARDIDDLMVRAKQASAISTRLAALPGPSARPDGKARSDAPSSTAAYILPVTGTLITGTGEMSGSGVRSRGITLATAPGAQISAPAKGRIAFAGPYGGFGQIVIIDHGSDWTTLITDMARLSVSAGQSVQQGDRIGTAPASAHPAITIELRKDERPMDIIAMVNADH